MPTHTNVPVDMLPSELSSGLKKGSKVTVDISTDDEPIAGYTNDELNALLKDIGTGKPIAFESHDDFTAYLNEKLQKVLSKADRSA